jgi:CheY-like chemotaxis protein
VTLRVGLPLESLSAEVIASMFGIDTEPPSIQSPDGLELHSAIALARRFGVTIQGTEVPPGVSLRLTCPLVAARPPSEAAAPVRAATSAPILLFDAPAHTLRALETELEESGYEPLRVQHRDEALCMLLRRSPAAVVIATDLSSDVPLQFARHVRSTPLTSRIPIVLVARDLSPHEWSMARRYVDGVLVAPVSARDTARYLNGCLASERRSERRALELY